MNGYNEGYRCEGNETIPAHKSRVAMTGDLWHPWRPEIFQTTSDYRSRPPLHPVRQKLDSAERRQK